MEILIVEDDFISRSLLKKMLLSIGQKVIEAENGRKAWEVIKERSCKFIITDWIMPEMDGLELCRRVRQNYKDNYVYIIMLTVKDRKKDLVNVLETGADDFIPKPFDPEELRARVLTGIRILELEDNHIKLQQNIVESRKKLRTVFDCLQEQIVSIDPDFTIVSANKSFVKDTRLGIDHVVGKNCEQLKEESAVLKNYSSKIIPLVQNVFARGKANENVIIFDEQPDSKIYKQVNCLPIKDKLERVVQTVVVMKDITEERRNTEKIRQLNERLLESYSQIEAKNKKLEQTLVRLKETQHQMLHSEKMASIGQLAAGVAHEINNPTGFVSSNLKTLGDYQKDMHELILRYQKFLKSLESAGNKPDLSSTITPKIQSLKDFEEEIDIDFLIKDTTDLISDCREGASRIKKIVLDLKDFAHPNEDKVQSTDINNGILSTLNVVSNEIKYKASVTKHLEQIPKINGYPHQLNQVFMNILINAAQSIEKNGNIDINTRSQKGFVEISISDTGCGIPEENINRIFDPFFTTKDVGKGTGLGMNIAFNIIKKHKGTIDVSSTVGKGTTFLIRLPVENSSQPSPAS
ncbi:MAG: response regulator [Desulfobacteraceae bacterium]|nr:response regulator [Desulfobacteraceae bacterium]